MAEPFRRRAREQLLPPSGYTLDKSDPDILVLRRADGSFVAAFSSRAVTSEGIREAVEADVREQEPFSRRQNDPGTCPAEAGSGGTRIDGT
jgi:hypothetical protein